MLSCLRPMLVDSHAHLDDPAFDPDREVVIERARNAGLRYLLAVSGGTGPEHLAAPIPIAESHDWIYATVGVHPHEAQHFQETHAEQMCLWACHPKVIAIGEIGLDYHYDHSPREAQKQTLVRQFEIAREARVPVVIHCREAWADLRELVREHWQSSGLGGILHCFSGSREDAFAFLDWGFLISFAGNLTYKKAENLRSVARQIPLDRLLTETDSPYLTPVPHRGKRNEPAFVAQVTRELAAQRSVSEAAMGQLVMENFARLFHLA